jgi:very-short-patch-repair endonuclease
MGRSLRSSPAMKRMTARARQLRRSETLSEHILWEALRGAKMAGRKWRRQQKIERFVVDFFCAEERLVVEIDGGIHADRREADLERERILERHGLRVVRFSADLVEKDLPCVLARLREHLSPSPPAGEGARG